MSESLVCSGRATLASTLYVCASAFHAFGIDDAQILFEMFNILNRNTEFCCI